MVNEKNKKDRSLRSFGMILYSDSTAYDCESILSDVISNYEFAWIKHDKDVDEDGVLKKEHIHVLVSFNSPRKLSWILSRFKQSHIEIISSNSAYLRYMTHSDSDDSTKYIYPDSDLHLSSKFKAIFDKDVKHINIVSLVTEYYLYCNKENLRPCYSDFVFWIAASHDSYITDVLRFAYALKNIIRDSHITYEQGQLEVSKNF